VNESALASSLAAGQSTFIDPRSPRLCGNGSTNTSRNGSGAVMIARSAVENTVASVEEKERREGDDANTDSGSGSKGATGGISSARDDVEADIRIAGGSMLPTLPRLVDAGSMAVGSGTRAGVGLSARGESDHDHDHDHQYRSEAPSSQSTHSSS